MTSRVPQIWGLSSFIGEVWTYIFAQCGCHKLPNLWNIFPKQIIVLVANWHSGFTAAILTESYRQITTSLSAERHNLQQEEGDDDADSSFHLKKLREDDKILQDWGRGTDILDTFDAPSIDSEIEGSPRKRSRWGRGRERRWQEEEQSSMTLQSAGGSLDLRVVCTRAQQMVLSVE